MNEYEVRANEQMDHEPIEMNELNELSNKMDLMMKNISAEVSSQFQSMQIEIESRIKLEFNKMQSEIDLCNEKNENSAKRKKTVQNTNGAIVDQSIQLENAHSNIDFSNLKPPSFPEVNDTKEFYSLLVSKFDTSVKANNVTNHIVNIKGINRELFKLTEMKSNNATELSKRYVSYKITRLQAEVYNTIKNEQLWAPDYSVRDFYTESSFGRNNNNQNRKSVPKTNWQRNRNNVFNRNGEDRRDFVLQREQNYSTSFLIGNRVRWNAINDERE